MNINGLDLNLIRVFDALYSEKSATRAWARIGLSQPAVSAALNRLRHALHDQLFIRCGNEMVATPRADELAGRARAALDQIEGMLGPVRTVDPSRLERTFTFLGSDFFSMLLMPQLARDLATEAPGVRLRLLDSARGGVARLLQDDAVDIALERPVDLPDFIASTPLFRSPFVGIAGRDNPAVADLETGKPLPLELFTRLPHALRSIDGGMSGHLDEALALIGRRRRVTLALPHFQAVALAVADGSHIAAVPAQFAAAVAEDLGLKIFLPPIEVPAPEIQLYWHVRHTADPAHGWMRTKIEALSETLGFRRIG